MSATSLFSTPISTINSSSSSPLSTPKLSPASLSFLSSTPGTRGRCLISRPTFPLRRRRGLPLEGQIYTSLQTPYVLLVLETRALYLTGVVCIDKINYAKKETLASFDELITVSDKPVLVDFYATWCGPCQFMVSVLNEVSQALKDSINVTKIDTEKYPSIANRYSVEALPTLIIFRDGQPCARFEGALPAGRLIQWINNSLEKVAA